jgi:hypothetical protein
VSARATAPSAPSGGRADARSAAPRANARKPSRKASRARACWLCALPSSPLLVRAAPRLARPPSWSPPTEQQSTCTRQAGRKEALGSPGERRKVSTAQPWSASTIRELRAHAVLSPALVASLADAIDRSRHCAPLSLVESVGRHSLELRRLRVPSILRGLPTVTSASPGLAARAVAARALLVSPDSRSSGLVNPQCTLSSLATRRDSRLAVNSIAVGRR